MYDFSRAVFALLQSVVGMTFLVKALHFALRLRQALKQGVAQL